MSPEAGGIIDNPVWQSRRLWSLWEMLELKSAKFIRANNSLVALSGAMLPVEQNLGPQGVVGRENLSQIQTELEILCEVLRDLEAPTTAEAAKRLMRALADPATKLGALTFLLSHVLLTLKTEFSAQLFLALSREEARLYAISEPPFGSEVERKFAAVVSEDIAEASRCIACSRYTASVFHLMRVLEIGTTKFAGLLGALPIDSRGKEKNWQNFLDEVGAKIKALPPQDLTTRKYAAISSNLYHVKLAWRNEVMHPKQTYTGEEAREVFAASKSFMRELASVL